MEDVCMQSVSRKFIDVANNDVVCCRGASFDNDASFGGGWFCVEHHDGSDD